MATVNYITPITDRTQSDIEYAKSNQTDLINKNKGAWNYTDANRVCNNLQYAAEYMYEQGFLNEPYSMQINTSWTETDIITYEELNNTIVNTMNNLKTYSRSDLSWVNIALIANMDYNMANYIEMNINALATQLPLEPDEYNLVVANGSGTGIYPANTVVTISANPPGDNLIFSYWSGDHLENLDSPTSSITTYTMPHQDIALQANYTGITPTNLTVITDSDTKTYSLLMGAIQAIQADPAPMGKVFHHWIVEPEEYEENLYEPSATTNFTMPNEPVTLTAVYITKGQKYLKVENGTGSGWYDYGTYVSIASDKESNYVFNTWSGDTQYLTGNVTTEYNSVQIPDVSTITVTGNYSRIPSTNLKLTIVNGVIASTGETTGIYNEDDNVTIIANDPDEGDVFTGWTDSNDGYVSNSSATTATVSVGSTDMIVTANYRTLVYSTLHVTTDTDETIETLESLDLFEVSASPYPDNYTFSKWTGDTSSYNNKVFYTSNSYATTYMGLTDRTIVAEYRPIEEHTLTIKQLSGDYTYVQKEFTKLTIVAEDPVEGEQFSSWSISGVGSVSSTYSSSTSFTFGNGDTTLTPRYSTIPVYTYWEITVNNGKIANTSTSPVSLIQGWTYDLDCRDLANNEQFDGWTMVGAGTIYNTSSTSTSFVVGEGDAEITANISYYPDKTLTIYMRDPDTNTNELISTETYTYGSNITVIAPVAPDKTTFNSWLGDVEQLSPSALASTVYISGINKDTYITATYYYPEAPQYYTLTVYDGYPESQNVAAGSQVAIRPNSPSDGYEFYKWYGDTQYLVNPDTTQEENAVIMPFQAITLYAKFKVIGELSLFRVSVTNGIASGTYIDASGIEHSESGVYIDVPSDIQVTLTANDDVIGYTFDYWFGNFETAGVTDIVTTNNPTTFTMVENDLNIVMVRTELDKYTIYTTDASGGGEYYVGTYPIAGSLQDTDNIHYEFQYWTCVDVDKNDYISSISDPNNIETTVTLTDRSLWVTAVYLRNYKLTVIEGQDTGDGYYYNGEIVNTVYANTPSESSKTQFDHWEDPMGIILNIYDPTPYITMKDSVANITAVFVSTDAAGNSIVMTGDDVNTGIITRRNSNLINGIFAVGTLVFDNDGNISIITEVDPDLIDDTDDYKVEKLFYGGEE